MRRPSNDRVPLSAVPGLDGKPRMRVYRTGRLWYAQCPACVDEGGSPRRWPSAWLPYTHAMATRHVEAHRTGAIA